MKLELIQLIKKHRILIISVIFIAIILILVFKVKFEPFPQTNWAGYQITTDGRCGQSWMRACPGNQCCSKSGVCGGEQGKYDDWCRPFGKDSGKYDGKKPDKNWAGKNITTNGRCGTSWNNTACIADECCSSSGWCGLNAHCGVARDGSGGIYDGEPREYMVCGVNSNSDIFCARTNAGALLEPLLNWVKLPGKLINLSLNKDGSIFGVNSVNNIFYASSYKNPNWVQLPGKLKQICSNNDIVMGINYNNDVFYADQNITSNPNWTQLPIKLTDLSVDTDGTAFGVNSAGNVYCSQSYKSGIWNMLPGNLNRISCNNGVVMGVNSDNDVFYADKNIKSNPNWTHVTGKLIDVSVNFDGSVYGVNSANNIFYAPYYNIPHWTQVRGELSQISGF